MLHLTIRALDRFICMRKLILLFALLALTAAAGDRSHFTYIYKKGGHTHMRSSMDIERMVKVSKRWEGDYVWLRLDGKEWLIRDAAVLAEVNRVFAEMHALEPAKRAADAQRHPYEVKIEALEKQIDALTDDDDENVNDKRVRELERQMRAIEREYEAVERKAEKLEEEMDRLEEIAEVKFDQIVLRAVRQGKAVRVDS
jgi:vacuolar-type H+-ATPase subunit I/STV1